MKLLTYRHAGRVSWGAVVDDAVVDLGAKFQSRYAGLREVLTAAALPELQGALAGATPGPKLAEIEFLAPIRNPEKILCVGVNYANRNAEYADNSDLPKYPSLFMRTPGSLVGHDAPIIRPPESEQLDYEGEIVLIIGRGGRRIRREDALQHVAAFTIMNEGSVRDWLRHGKFNVTQGKNFDASGSIGPWIVTSDEIDLSKPLRITVKVNGELTQDDTTASMIKSFADLIVYVSTFMTLKPGDIIVTGTPVKLGARTEPPTWLKAGDTVEIEVPEIGVLRNTVTDEPCVTSTTRQRN